MKEGQQADLSAFEAWRQKKSGMGKKQKDHKGYSVTSPGYHQCEVEFHEASDEWRIKIPDAWKWKHPQIDRSH